MTSQMFVTGEWGSVAMRLNLCRSDEGDVTVVDTVTGGGVVGCPDFEAAFFDAAGAWFKTHGPLPVILAGMIGSNIGWRDSGYVTCPAGIAEMAGQLTSISARGVPIHFTPGLKCRNIFGLPDVIRGEEMQVLGWLGQQSEMGQRLVCLPGRHVKWLITEGRRIVSFFTGMSGELEDLLLGHSLLGKGVLREGFHQSAFDAGLDAIVSDPSLSLGHALFATRSRLIFKEHSPAEAASFLKGLLIGADVRDSLLAHQSHGFADKTVFVMDHGALTGAYKQAIETMGFTAQIIRHPVAGVLGLASVLAPEGFAVQQR